MDKGPSPSETNLYTLYTMDDVPITLQPVPSYPDIILALNIISTHPPRFHWLIFVPDVEPPSDDIFSGLKLHAREYPNPPSDAERWFFEVAEFRLATSKSVVAAAVIGQLKDKTVNDLRDVLSTIPLGVVPAADVDLERYFTCRVWVREALRIMHREGFIHCPNVDKMEDEMWDYGEAAADQVAKRTWTKVATLRKAVNSSSA